MTLSTAFSSVFHSAPGLASLRVRKGSMSMIVSPARISQPALPRHLRTTPSCAATSMGPQTLTNKYSSSGIVVNLFIGEAYSSQYRNLMFDELLWPFLFEMGLNKI